MKSYVTKSYVSKGKSTEDKEAAEATSSEKKKSPGDKQDAEDAEATPSEKNQDAETTSSKGKSTGDKEDAETSPSKRKSTEDKVDVEATPPHTIFTSSLHNCKQRESAANAVVPSKKDRDEYIRTHIEHDTYTYDDCCNYPELMEHHVKVSMRRGYQQNTKEEPLFYPKCPDREVIV